MKLKNKLKNKLNNKLNNKLVGLLLIIMVTLAASFFAACAEKATTSGGTTGGGSSITDGGGGEPATCAEPAADVPKFISKWDVSEVTDSQGKPISSAANKIKLPLVSASKGGDYDFTVYWGDCTPSNITEPSTITTGDIADATHEYTQAAIAANGSTTFTVTITGEIKGWQFGNGVTTGSTSPANNGTSDAAKLVEISSFGPLDLGDTAGYQFYKAKNLTITATAGAPTLTSTKNLSYAFAYTGITTTTGFDGDLSEWNVSAVEDMSFMFSSAENFNGDLSNWERPSTHPNGFSTLANVKKMANMFQRAVSFNQPIGTWNVSMVDTMQQMFNGATHFNQPIGTWEVGRVTTMYYMFSGARDFNQD